jgi:ankyrin repeat protein
MDIVSKFFIQFLMDKLEDLTLAISAGSLDIVRHLVEFEQVNINAFNRREQTALCLAVAYGHSEIVKYLLKMRADVNVGLGTTGIKPIHIAASNGFAPIVGILRDSGADLNARDQCGMSPMDFASISPQPVAPDCQQRQDRIDTGDEQLVSMRSECIKALG